jgi:hypothetical protein
MKALEFKSKIRNNQIHIPTRIQSELKISKNKDIRVIVLIEDSEIYNDLIFQQSAKTEFLKGYSKSDSIYDNY